jgi:hypothetical protein
VIGPNPYQDWKRDFFEKETLAHNVPQLRQEIAYEIIKKISGEQSAATFMLTGDAEIALGKKSKIRKFYKMMDRAGFPNNLWEDGWSEFITAMKRLNLPI